MFENRLNILAEATLNFAIASFILAIFAGTVMHVIYTIGLRGFVQRVLVRKWISNRLDFLKRRFADKKKDYTKLSRYGYEDNERSPVGEEKDYYRSMSSLRKKLLGQLHDGGAEAVEEALLRSVSAGNTRRLYSLSYSQLCGQISSVIATSVGDQLDYLLMYFFAYKARFEDIYLVIEGYDDKFLNFVKNDNGGDIKNELIGEANQRVVYYVERNIDDLQVFLENSWGKFDYFFSLCVSFIIVATLLVASEGLGIGFQDNVLYLSVGIFGALLAPISYRALDRLLSK